MPIQGSIGEFELADGAVTARKLGAFALARAALQSAGQVISTAFVDIVGAAVTATTNGISKVNVDLTFSSFANGAGQWSIQLLVDGVQTGEIFQAFWNTVAQHQSWSFNWLINPPAAGSHTFKIQVKSVAVVNLISMDTNDHIMLRAWE